MNIPRTATILGVSTVGLTLILGTGIASATTPWQGNENGWNIHLQNDSHSLLHFEPSLFGNVKHGNEWLQQGQVASIEGIRSIVSGPANVNFVYRNTWASQDGISVRISSTPAGAVSAECQSVKPAFVTMFRCEVTQADPAQPIAIVIHDK
ncbi:hypothetical protein LQL77_31990 [Rhodococcus cerastii]|nr:hypothetical protein [Rhodococcus cerastii]